MNIYTVRDNLIRTIEGKQKYLTEIYEQREASKGDDLVSFVTAQMLETNLTELRAILRDVAECCTIATESSWIGVDRQGGI